MNLPTADRLCCRTEQLIAAKTDVQAFALVHLVSKLGTATNDAVTSLKLLEKGLSKEDLALAVLIDFPFQLIFGWIAARWSTGDRPLRPVSLRRSVCSGRASWVRSEAE